MFAIYGNVTGTGPITINITSQYAEPDPRLLRLVRELEVSVAKLDNEIREMEAEVAELDTTVAGTEAIVERIATAVETNIGNETKLRSLVASLRGGKGRLAAANAKGTAAAEELEKEDNDTNPEPPNTPTE